MMLKRRSLLTHTFTTLSYGENLRLMQSKFKIDESNVFKFWNHKCDNESDAVRLSVQVRELCGWREKCNCKFLNKVECKIIIDFLCTD